MYSFDDSGLPSVRVCVWVCVRVWNRNIIFSIKDAVKSNLRQLKPC